MNFNISNIDIVRDQSNKISQLMITVGGTNATSTSTIFATTGFDCTNPEINSLQLTDDRSFWIVDFTAWLSNTVKCKKIYDELCKFIEHISNNPPTENPLADITTSTNADPAPV